MFFFPYNSAMIPKYSHGFGECYGHGGILQNITSFGNPCYDFQKEYTLAMARATMEDAHDKYLNCLWLSEIPNDIY